LALLVVSNFAGAVELTLVADNTRSSSGTLSYQVFKSCTPPSNAAGTGCSTFASAWQVANGVTGSTATWDWDGTTLTATGMFQSTSHLSSNPNGSAVISDKTVNLTINTATMTTTAASYNCIEGNFLANVGAHGCLNTETGTDFANNSSALYNVGGDAACINRTIGGDDVSTGNVRGLTTRAAGGGCDATDGAYDLWTVVTDNTATGGQLILSNGVDIAAAGTHFLTFQRVADAVDDGPVDVLEATPAVINVGANDIAFTGTVTVTIIENPTQAPVPVVSMPGPAADQTITYTSNAGATGTDSFVYSITDGVNTDTATVTVSILPFGANDDSVATTRGVQPAPIAVGANDVGFGDSVQVTIANSGVCDRGGMAVVSAGQGGVPGGIRVTYTPAATLPGSAGYTETCTYTIDDGIAPPDEADILITVSNLVPVANDGNASAITVTPGDTVVGRTATFTSPGLGGSLGNAGITTAGDGAYGSTSVSGNVITYTITDPDFVSGSDTFTYTVTDPDGADEDETDSGTVTVTITVQNAVPTLAVGPITTIANTESAAITPTFTLGNGSVDQHTLAITTNGTHGNCVFSSAASAEVDDSDVYTAGTVVYTPNNGYTGTDSCTLTLTDTAGAGQTVAATIDVTVNPAPAGRGGGGALDLWSLALLGGLSFLRFRRKTIMAIVPLIILGAVLGVPASALAQQVEEIVVTSRRVEEKLKEVPLSITAFDSGTIDSAGISSLTDVANLTPGLSFFNAFGENLPVPIIRGVVPQDIFGVNATAIFVDGVYVSGREGLNFSQLDVERIEVLKGPQSAMYGRNAFAGAINYVTKPPSDIFESKAETELGNRGKQRVMGSVSGPLLGETLTGRISAMYDEWDGSYDNTLAPENDIGGYRYRSLQGRLRWRPADDLEINLGLYSSNDEIDDAAVGGLPANCEDQVETTTENAEGGPFPRLQNWCGRIPDLAALPDRLDPTQFPNMVLLTNSITKDSMPKLGQAVGEDRDLLRGNLNISWDRDFGSFDLLTGYSDTEQNSISDFNRSSGDSIPLIYCPDATTVVPPATCNDAFGWARAPMGVYNIENGSHVEEWSQELRFTSLQDEPLRYMGGFYYYRVDQKNLPGDPVAVAQFPGSFMDVGIGPAPYPTSLAIGSYIFGQSLTPNGAIDPEVRVRGREKTESWSIFGALDFDFAEAWTAGAEIRLTQEAQKAYNFRYKRCAQPNDAAHDPYGPFETSVFPFNDPPVDDCGDDYYDLRVMESCIPIPLDDPDNPTQDTNGDGIVHPFEDGACTPGQDYATARFKTLTGRLSLKYQFDSGWMVYGSVAKGKKPGGLEIVDADVLNATGQGFNSEVSFNPFDPEKMIAYEIGIKGFTPDRRIGLDMAVFYNDWTDIVLRQLSDTSPLSGRPFEQPEGLNINSGDAEVWGVEVSADVGFTDYLTGRFTVGWTDSELKNARMDTFSLFPSFYTTEPSCVPAAIQALPAGDQDAKAAWCQKLSGDVSGNTQMRQPEWQGSASLSYERPLTGDWTWFARGDANYLSKIYIGNDNQGWLPDRTNVNLRLGVQSPRYSVEFWVRNLFENNNPIAAFRDIYWTNDDDIQGTQNPARFQDASNFDDFPPFRMSVSYPSLRTYGLVAKMRFGGAER
jgi:outer membrane receptor protein involved in Fe transport